MTTPKKPILSGNQLVRLRRELNDEIRRAYTAGYRAGYLDLIVTRIYQGDLAQRFDKGLQDGMEDRENRIRRKGETPCL